ncbi:hypothetical protein MDMS009_2906 [Methylophaga thiooxydans DMS010]|uniref:HPP transmembrane region domain-containing protein n=2 Tax=Methylophaga thiooxydans TaxID=392484 RepID=C0N9G1_9GAMM|nr:hypothetical protein MDMS009_2906 [Methylophaga thiooxydans DMS010]
MIATLKQIYRQCSTTEIAWQERLFSSLGACIAIFFLSYFINALSPYLMFNPVVLASMGASTFLLFAVPHSPLAQPWQLLAGHLCAAFIGVGCCKLIPDLSYALAVSVSLSVFVMYLLNCMHPPAAATAMIAIIGGEQIVAQGWAFAYITIAANVFILLVLTLILNNLIPGRRYPLNHQHHPHHNAFKHSKDNLRPLYEDDFRWALSQMETYIDVTEEDLVDLYEFAVEHAQKKGNSRH